MKEKRDLKLAEKGWQPTGRSEIRRLRPSATRQPPKFRHQLHSPKFRPQLHFPKFRPQLHFPKFRPQLHFPKLHHPLHSPDVMQSPSFLSPPMLTNYVARVILLCTGPGTV